MWCFLALLVFVFSSGFGKNQKQLILIQTEDDSQNGRVDVTADESTNESKDLEVFQPTSEWQAILPGQGIPAGLHVRMNLQTGEKEAKLMDGDDGSKYQKTKDAKQKSITIDKNLISKQHLKEALKDFRDKFHDENPHGENPEELQNRVNATKTFKSIEEIRKELEGIDLFLRKDIEIITEHVQVLNSSSSSVEEKEHALDELEYYVHQIDNARDLHSIGGLSLVIRLMNSSEEGLRARACFVLGSATQSNPHVQQAVMKQGALPLLLLLLSKEEPMSVRKKAMYALSALIRLFPLAQQAFLKLNGLGIFQTLCEEPGAGPLAVKVITLLTDLLTEQIDAVKTRMEKQGQNFTGDVSGKVPLLKRMVERGWCKLVPSLLRTTENDVREKVLQALHVMVTGCKSDFKQSDVQNRLNRLKTEWLNDASRLDVDESEYVLMLVELVADLIGKLT